ncbi:MAG: type II secretion system protein, partial [Terriglobia bacterium]
IPSMCILRAAGRPWMERITQTGEAIAFGRRGRKSSELPAHRIVRGRYGLTARRSGLGFTLIEMMVVMTIILILASFAVPTYTTAIKRAKEAVLRDDLYTMRNLIDEYTADKQQPPSSLQDLVDDGYLRGGIPVDPITGSNQTWKADIEDVPTSPSQAQPGVVDVHSGSDATSLEGSPYSGW